MPASFVRHAPELELVVRPPRRAPAHLARVLVVVGLPVRALVRVWVLVAANDKQERTTEQTNSRRRPSFLPRPTGGDRSADTNMITLRRTRRTPQRVARREQHQLSPRRRRPLGAREMIICLRSCLLRSSRAAIEIELSPCFTRGGGLTWPVPGTTRSSALSKSPLQRIRRGNKKLRHKCSFARRPGWQTLTGRGSTP